MKEQDLIANELTINYKYKEKFIEQAHRYELVLKYHNNHGKKLQNYVLELLTYHWYLRRTKEYLSDKK